MSSNNKRKSVKDLESTSFVSFEKINKELPFLINLNEDPMISDKMCYSFGKYPVIEIGRQSDDRKNLRIVLNSVGIIQNHAKMFFEGEKVFLESTEPDGAFNCFVNGECLEDYEEELSKDFIFKKELKDKDRIIFGTCTTFLFRFP